MPYSIPGSTKNVIYIYILWQQHHFFILVGTLCVCEFAMVPGVYILLCPPGRKVTLFFLHIQLHNHQKDLNPSLWLYYYGKVIVELENNTNNRKILTAYGAFNLTKQHFEIHICFLFLFLRWFSNTFRHAYRFCPLSKTPRVVNHLLFLTDKTKLDGTPSQIKWKIQVCWYIVFYVLKVYLIKDYKIKLVCQLLYFLLFYIASELTSADIFFITF